jgi:SAM-dependent methyltransferase
MMIRNTEFNPLAATYNRCWGADYHKNAFPALERLLLAELPENAHILDVCCGTGQFTRRVRDGSFQVTGVDASEEMIRFARQNVPDSEFVVADVREFSLGRKFAAAYSVFESLNHIPDVQGLEAAFRCVREHLEPDASFLFDLNGDDAFTMFWNDTHAIVEDDMVCVLRSNYDAMTRLAACHVTLFESGSEWTRKDFTLRQTCHQLGDVHNALEEAGFETIVLYDARDAGMSETTGFDRTFFLATT